MHTELNTDSAEHHLVTDRHAISPYPIRMPAALRERLEESAKAGSRSLHAEIISRLEASYDYIPEGAALPQDQGKSELDRIWQEGLMLSTLKKGKLNGIHLLNEQLDKVSTPEEKAALSAALSVANAELDALFDRSSELRSREHVIRGQQRLGDIADYLGEASGDADAESPKPTIKRISRPRRS